MLARKRATHPLTPPRPHPLTPFNPFNPWCRQVVEDSVGDAWGSHSFINTRPGHSAKLADDAFVKRRWGA